VPKKLAVLLAALARAGFVSRGGKGSHRNYEHPSGHRLIVSVHKGEAKPYQQRDIEEAVQIAYAWEKLQKEKEANEND
jgi:predicted RNA binding protein YcfA (HicA-like mRNA interferase family)